MKYLFYSLIIIITCTSCKSKTAQQGKDSTNNGSALINEFKPILQGVWVKKDYIEEVARTKSPVLAFEKVGDITTIDIVTGGIKNDTLRVDVGYGNHDGGFLLLKFTSGNLPGSIIASDPLDESHKNAYELKYFINQNDTTLTLYTYQNKKIIDSTTYVKTVNDGSGKELGYGTYFAVNKLLVTGNYLLTDTLNNTSKINFSNEGDVTGLEGFKRYMVQVDFNTPPNNLDEIIFDPYKNAKSYAFKLNKDTLNLYDTSMDKDSVDLVLGKRVYKLVKQK